MQDVGFFHAGERGKIGKTFHPARKVGEHGGDLRLLQHDFRNQNRVRIARAPPRQIAAVFGKPSREQSAERFWILDFGI